MNFRTRYLTIFVFVIILSCKKQSVYKTIPGRYYGASIDGFTVIELDTTGGAKRYNKHMGGDFEWTGKWSCKRDSVLIQFYKRNTILEDEEEINDTSMWAINKQDGSLSFFKKINNEKDKIELTDKFIIRIKRSVRKYDEN